MKTFVHIALTDRRFLYRNKCSRNGCAATQITALVKANKDLTQKPTIHPDMNVYKKPKRVCSINVILINNLKSYECSCAVEIGLSDFHR